MISTIGRAALLGAATGARSMIGLAAVAATTAPPTTAPGTTPPGTTPAGTMPAGTRPRWLGWVGSGWGRGLTAAGAAGELILDKSPALPSRTLPPVLAGRIALGAIAAAVLARRRGEPAALPMLVAGAAVVVASITGQRWRRYARERGHATAGALVEDLVAAGLAARAAHSAG